MTLNGTRVKLNEVTDGIDFGLLMMILDEMVIYRENKKRLVRLLKILFYYLNGDIEERNFSTEGFQKFYNRFGNMKRYYDNIVTREDKETYMDVWYEFLDDCFPIRNDEDVEY